MSKDNDLYLRELHLKDGKLDMAIQGDAVVDFGRLAAEWFVEHGGENFCSLRFYAEGIGWCELVLQREGKKTPADVAAERAERIKFLEQVIDEAVHGAQLLCDPVEEFQPNLVKYLNESATSDTTEEEGV